MTIIFFSLKTLDLHQSPYLVDTEIASSTVLSRFFYFIFFLRFMCYRHRLGAEKILKCTVKNGEQLENLLRITMETPFQVVMVNESQAPLLLKKSTGSAL